MDLVWWKAISLMHLKAVINFVAGLWSWLGLSSHSGAIAQLAHLGYGKLEIPMKCSQRARFGPLHILA